MRQNEVVAAGGEESLGDEVAEVVAGERLGMVQVALLGLRRGPGLPAVGLVEDVRVLEQDRADEAALEEPLYSLLLAGKLTPAERGASTRGGSPPPRIEILRMG